MEVLCCRALWRMPEQIRRKARQPRHARGRQTLTQRLADNDLSTHVDVPQLPARSQGMVGIVRVVEGEAPPP